MKHLRFFLRGFAAVAVMFIAQATFAQSLRTGYFMDGNMFRYRINPAQASERGHFSLPILGGLNVTTEGNIGFADLFYDSPLKNDEYVFFTHNSVDTKSFLDRFDAANDIHLNFDVALLSAGFHAFGGYNTIDVSMHSRVAMNLPYDLFRFMKVANPMLDDLINGRIPVEDMGANSFNADNILFNNRNYIDIALGHSRAINEHLNVGARAKLLLGLGYANVEFDRMNIEYDNIDSWSIESHGVADVTFGGDFKYLDKQVGATTQSMVMGYRGAELGVQGLGFGLDLGATYDFSGLLLEGLKASASLNDIGFIRWRNTASAEIAGDKYTFGGFNRMGIITGTESIDEQIDDLTKDLGDFLALHEKEGGDVTTGIGAKLNLGLEYEMPFYKKMSIGALYTHCFDEVYAYDQTSLVLTVSPLSICDFAVSSTFADYGTRFGAMANLHFTGFSLFVGTDCMLSELSDSKYPFPNDNLNANLSVGVNIAFSKVKR